MTKKNLLDYFYKKEAIRISDDGTFEKELNYELLRGQRASEDIVDADSGKVFVKRGRRISQGAIRQMQEAGIKFQPIAVEDMVGKVLAADIKDGDDNLIMAINSDLDTETIKEIVARGVKDFRYIVYGWR